MTETKLFDRAIEFAERVHLGQMRKGKDAPYINHIYDVVSLLRLFTQDQELWSAGALHDTVEDCVPYGSVTLEAIRELAGPRVSQIVGDLTEEDKNLPWRVRKQLALDHIVMMEQDSLLVKSADILANLTEMVADLREVPAKEFFKRFNAGKDAVVESYARRIEVIGAQWQENPFLPQLNDKLAELLDLAN